MKAPYLIFFFHSHKMQNLNNLHILIAEDDSDDADIICDAFTKNNNFEKVNLVANGEELLNYLKNSSNKIPDVILTDINMPIVDGIEALQEILNTTELKNIPCFVYSTSINPAYKEKCDLLGIKAYLIKPYSIEGFDEIPKSILSMIE